MENKNLDLTVEQLDPETIEALQSKTKKHLAELLAMSAKETNASYRDLFTN